MIWHPSHTVAAKFATTVESFYCDTIFKASTDQTADALHVLHLFT